jgi:glycosyltransferase involved in cell wall biosynthesis
VPEVRWRRFFIPRYVGMNNEFSPFLRRYMNLYEGWRLLLVICRRCKIEWLPKWKKNSINHLFIVSSKVLYLSYKIFTMREMLSTYKLFPAMKKRHVVKRIFNSWNYSWRIICFINDGSTDKTLQVLTASRKSTRIRSILFRYWKNLGKRKPVRQLLQPKLQPPIIGYLMLI